MYRRAQIAAVVAASCMLTAGAGRTSQSYTESGAMTDPLQEAGAWMEELSAADYHTAYMEDKMDGLREEILEMTSAAAGSWSVYVKDLGTDLSFVINDQPMYAASIIKLFVMESCYGHMDLLVENDCIYSGSEEESRSKTEQLLHDMITVSDNNSCNELVRMHSADRSFAEGCEVIGTWLSGTACEDTGIFHSLSPSDTERESISDERNRTSAADCGRLLEEIYEGTCVSEGTSEEMLGLLLDQQRTGKIPSGVPEGVVTANKTGETDEVQHDAAIVFGAETDYILCVMSADASGSEAAVSTIQEISAMVYDCLNPLG